MPNDNQPSSSNHLAKDNRLRTLQRYANIQFAASDLGQQTHLSALRNTIVFSALQIDGDETLSDNQKTPTMMDDLTKVLIGDPGNNSTGLIQMGVASDILPQIGSLQNGQDNRNEGAYHVRSGMGFRADDMLDYVGDSGFSPQFQEQKKSFQTQHAFAGVLDGYHSQCVAGLDSAIPSESYLGTGIKLLQSAVGSATTMTTGTVLHYMERLTGTKADAKLYDASVPVGADLAAGTITRLQLGDAIMSMIGDDQHRILAQQTLEKLTQTPPSEIRQALASNPSFSLTERPTIGKPLADVLPSNIQSMLSGSDELGTRSDIDHITVGPSGIKAGDNRNDLRVISARANDDPSKEKPHLLILEDGTVQGPESGGVPFDRNAPFDRRGRKGDGLAVMYAGTGTPNPLQTKTLNELSVWLETERKTAGYGGTIRVEGNSPQADQILQQHPAPQMEIQAQSIKTQRPAIGP